MIFLNIYLVSRDSFKFEFVEEVLLLELAPDRRAAGGQVTPGPEGFGRDEVDLKKIVEKCNCLWVSWNKLTK